MVSLLVRLISRRRCRASREEQTDAAEKKAWAHRSRPEEIRKPTAMLLEGAHSRGDNNSPLTPFSGLAKPSRGASSGISAWSMQMLSRAALVSERTEPRDEFTFREMEERTDSALRRHCA